MTTFAVCMCKDEADVIEGAVARMLAQVDHVIVSDNDSTDRTREILEAFAADAVTVLQDPEVAYYQSRKMTALAHLAAARGAHWVIPFDADEVWLSPHGRIADVLAERSEALAVATVYDHVATAADDPDELDPHARLRYRRREPLSLPKVACRVALPVTIGQGNHVAHYDSSVADGLLEVRHFPYRGADQFVSKVRNGAAAYAATDLPDGVGAHWRQYGRHLDVNGEQALIDDVFRPHFWVADPDTDQSLTLDPLPVLVAA